jgi:predicted hotdog family 3-hydroxylacyl-ACP dehydratase
MTDAALPDVREVVPHEPPMLLLDRVRSYGNDRISCTVRIGPECLFVEERGAERQVPAVIGLEYMAQCVAAYAGLTARREGQAPRRGFLVGCRELCLEVEAFSVGDTLDVEARRVWGDSDLGSFACAVTRDGRTLVSGTLSVYQGALPEEPRP